MTTSQHFIRNPWKLLMKTNGFPCVGDFTPLCTSPLTAVSVVRWLQEFRGCAAPPPAGGLKEEKSIFTRAESLEVHSAPVVNLLKADV